MGKGSERSSNNFVESRIYVKRSDNAQRAEVEKTRVFPARFVILFPLHGNPG
jgi:hypothetical protein